MAYTQTTQAQLASQILYALNDPNAVYWSTDEVNRAISEALLFWGASTNYWRQRGTFTTTQGQAFYDLSTELPTLRARSYTFEDLVTEIQYHLNESPTGFAFANQTTQFTSTAITDALIRSANEFGLDASITYAQQSIPGISTPRTDLPDDVIAIARASWTDSVQGTTKALRRIDAWEEDSFNPLWTTQSGLPFSFSASETPPINVSLYPPPANPGTLNLIYSDSAGYTGAVGATAFGIPDEYVHAVKWRAIYWLLSTQGQGYDPFRAKYCDQRYGAYDKFSESMRSVARVQVNNIPVPMAPIAELDCLRPYWQSKLGTPNFCGVLYDLLAFSDVPNTSVFSVTCDVVQSAPLPAASGDYIQVGYEELGYIADMARHILSFKLGGEEFATSFALYDNFMSGVDQRSKIVGIQTPYLRDVFGVPAKQADLVPVG